MAGVLILALGIVFGCLLLMFSQLPQSVGVGKKAFTAVYNFTAVDKSNVVPDSKSFLMSDGRGKFCRLYDSAPQLIVIEDYNNRKTYMIDKKEGTYVTYDLVKEGLADENAYRVPPLLQLLFLGEGNKNGYNCRHYIALFWFCVAGYIENWYSPELGCSVEFSPCFRLQSNGHMTLVKYIAEEPPAKIFDLSVFKKKADYSHK